MPLALWVVSVVETRKQGLAFKLPMAVGFSEETTAQSSRETMSRDESSNNKKESRRNSDWRMLRRIVDLLIKKQVWP